MNTEKTGWRLISNVLIKALLLFVAVNLLWMVVFPNAAIGKLSLYNRLWPGRERLPFGEDINQSYNLSLSNLDAMFASHMIAQEKAEDEFRIIVIGDSSIWGTLLQPQETLPAQLQQSLAGYGSEADKQIKVYNLGYPTLSLLKDLMILEKAKQYQADLILWAITLQSMPEHSQYDSAIVQQNTALILQMSEQYPKLMDERLQKPARVQTNLISRRRNLADLYRLQLLGFMWGASGIDQVYPAEYPRAQVDLPAETSFAEMNPPELEEEALAFDLITAGYDIAGETPLILINEPIMISNGENSKIRYNYYYPKWAYDQYRDYLLISCAAAGWECLDYWNALPMVQFTNTAIHYSAKGAEAFAEILAKDLIGLELLPNVNN
ncbi:MAG: SGNH/GDSL hydrolase family protein [Anaerolineaceae bacterium]|nr:SGNH/GDSL hydrolase family protein [Anaerolineaceae bacterium]